jgi:hypothetical protein
MRNLVAFASVAVALTATTHAAHAGGEDDYSGLAVAAPVFLGIEATPLVLGAADLVGKPDSKIYGGIELGAGALGTATNLALAIDFATAPNCSDCSGPVPYFAGLALVDAAVAAHGIYLLKKDRPDPTEIKLGSVHGHVAPTMVGDGRTNVAGLGIAGRF